MLAIKKSDVYYRFELSHDISKSIVDTTAEKIFDIRLRTFNIEKEGISTTKNYITYKKKNALPEKDITSPSYKGEVNLEYESEIENLEIHRMLLEKLGGKKLINKNKIGILFTVMLMVHNAEDSVIGECSCNIEIVEVPPLGFFLEIESISDNTVEKSMIENIQRTMKNYVSQLGIEESQIEDKEYITLLSKI